MKRLEETYVAHGESVSKTGHMCWEHSKGVSVAGTEQADWQKRQESGL
jgi:hypothetical protein